MTESVGSIVVPAHNEARVIGRCLQGLSGDDDRLLEVIVVANGCQDDTAAVARAPWPGLAVTVLELGAVGKQAALNAGDDAAGVFPRIYLDADVVLTRSSALGTLHALRAGALAARPDLSYDTQGASRLVRRYYRARARTPHLMGALWGAGCFGVSAEGRARWGAFPLSEPDDLFVDAQFARSEIVVTPGEPVRVMVPRRTRSLITTLTRVHAPALGAGRRERRAGSTRTLARVVAANRHWRATPDLAAYVALTVGARVARRISRPTGWVRDETTR